MSEEDSQYNNNTENFNIEHVHSPESYLCRFVILIALFFILIVIASIYTVQDDSSGILYTFILQIQLSSAILEVIYIYSIH